MDSDLPGSPEGLPESVRQGVDVIRDAISRVGNVPGVYRMLGAAGDVLYVGKAKALARRVVSYTRPMLLPVRLQRMIAQTRAMEFVTTSTEADALILESNLIKNLKPKYNVLLKDDKSYPYILLRRDHPCPGAYKFRGKPDPAAGVYFGPFASNAAVNETIVFLERAFMLRNCSDSYYAARKVPCLQYHIKRCSAPCVGRVSVDEYARQVRDASDFLSGKSRDVQARLQEEMVAASRAEAFERAAVLRDRISLLTTIQARQGVELARIGDADILGLSVREGRACVQVFFYRAGQSYGNKSFFWPLEGRTTPAEILSGFISRFYVGRPVPPLLLVPVLPKEDLLLSEAFGVRIREVKRGDILPLIQLVQKNADDALRRHLMEKANDTAQMERVALLFSMRKSPQRIEVYDNSHISGTNMIGAMIVASPDGFEKKSYRTFNIRGASASDDYGMMREVILRRFSKNGSEPIDKNDINFPDLLLIDGGAGQLTAVLEVLDGLGLSGDLTVVGIAKGEKRNAGREKFFMRGREMFQLPEGDPVLHYLQRLRDEAHRFAIGTHRARRAKSAHGSRLDDLPGIGPRRKKALLLHFGSAKAVEGASIQQLGDVDGISAALAKTIYDYFHAE